MSERDDAKRRGRPHADDRGVSLSAWVRTHEYDALYRKAKAREQTVSAYVRGLLRRELITTRR